MERTKGSFRSLQIDCRDVEDHLAPLHEGNGAPRGIGHVTVAKRHGSPPHRRCEAQL
jgi:hypothetical protein